MSFPRYDEYKDSGVEWLGEVPAHWEILPLRRAIASIDSGTSVNAIDTPALESELGVLKTSCVYRGVFDPLENKAILPDEYPRAHCPIAAGSLIVSRMNTPDLVGAAGLVKHQADNLYLPDRLWQVRFNEANASFVHRWTQSPIYRAQVQMVCAGASSSMQNLSQDDFRSFLLPLPPLPEQTAIAAFLDRETAKIDELVAEQQNLIALLKEKRQALISHAVTKGLNPNSPMKDSGVEWLGEVPAHWGLLQLRAVSSFTTSGPRGWSDKISECGSLFIQSGDLNDSMGVDFAAAKRVAVENNTEATRTQLSDGDVVVCITGAKTGNVAVCDKIPEPAYVNQHLCLIRPRKIACSGFLAAQLKSRVGQVQFELSQYGLKQGLSLENVRETMIVLPPLQEQLDIVAFIDTETGKIDDLVAEAESTITLLQERRTALISAAVTGKIDVRNVVARMEEAAA